MGTHPNVPATLQSSTSTTLASHLTANPGLIGEKVAKKFEVKDGNLPFLFKVLSIGTALSIQAHPDKKLAERLFKEHGDIYKGTFVATGTSIMVLCPQPPMLTVRPQP
jgi:mannose-6-phosphate isomerase